MEFDLAGVNVEFSCPVCEFYSDITYQEARLGGAIICRGCKNVLHPDDALGELEATRQLLMRVMTEMAQTLERLGG
jgi:hypothetical protein